MSKIKGFNKTPDRATQPGGCQNMDYGFVGGAKIIKNENGSLITSKEGYNVYFSIADEFSRHLWKFLIANKSLHIDNISSLLKAHDLKPGLR